jgi:hypothetical protein
VSLDLVLYLAFRLSSASFTVRDIEFQRLGMFFDVVVSLGGLVKIFSNPFLHNLHKTYKKD